jgi:hypothetical protein
MILPGQLPGYGIRSLITPTIAIDEVTGRQQDMGKGDFPEEK